MRVLLDACVWSGAATSLREAGHEVRTVADETPPPSDESILEAARGEQRVVITLDKDFGELAVVRRIPHAGIIRLVGLTSTQQGTAAVATLAKYGAELATGALITVEPTRVRVRAPQSSAD